MRTRHPSFPRLASALLAVALSGCSEGARIQALPQVITFAPAPRPAVGQSTVTVSATASSGLPVRYASRTPASCAVDATSGQVTASATGRCTVAANQPGSDVWAAAPQATQDVDFVLAGVVTFGPAPVMGVHDLATVIAEESSGRPVTFTSTTPVACAVDAGSGLVSAIAEGPCTVFARAGDVVASLTFPIAAPSGPAAPGAPSGAVASAGDGPSAALVRVGGVRAGGLPVTGWEVASVPPGLGATGVTLPVRVDCPSSCAGYRFSVVARNAVGASPPSAPGDLVTRYRVVATFHEPDTRPNDSIFVGTFSLNASAGEVSGLRGELGEAMTGGPVPYPDDTMTWLVLAHPLSAIPVTVDGASGWLVTTFRLDATATFTSDPRFGGTDGWAPGSGSGLHAGFPGANPGNAYVRIFVNAGDPTAAPTRGQLDRLAYADCAPGGMMGATCMTGTSVAGYGTVGTMGGQPVAQVTTRD